MACGAVAALGVNPLEDGSTRGQSQPRAAEFLGNQHRQIAGRRECIDELGRIAADGVELAPVFARKILTEAMHTVANLGEAVVGFGVLHQHGSQVNTSWLRSSGSSEPRNAGMA